MRARDIAADRTNPVESYELERPASLREALDAFAPEHASTLATQSDLNPADQFVRDIRSRRSALAPAPRRAHPLLARTADYLRLNARLVIALGGIAGALLGVTIATFVVDGPWEAPAPLPPSPILPIAVGDIELIEAPEPLPSDMVFGTQDGFKLVQPPPARPGVRRQPQTSGWLAPRAGRLSPMFGSGWMPFGVAGGTIGGLRPAIPTTAIASPLAGNQETPRDSDTSVYSSDDRDVRPPQMRSPELPGPTIPGAPTRTASMEVIVSERGVVERAKFLTPPRRMPDMMILSRAKMWEFDPASKDGRPVRYRLVLSWETSQ